MAVSSPVWVFCLGGGGSTERDRKHLVHVVAVAPDGNVPSLREDCVAQPLVAQLNLDLDNPTRGRMMG